MEVQLDQEVNIDVIGTLEYNKELGLVDIGYIPIPRPLDADFSALIDQFEQFNTAKEIIAFVKEHEKLKILLNAYNYCQYFGTAYQGLSGIEELEIRYRRDFENLDDKADRVKKQKERLREELSERLQAYNLEISYKECKNQIKIGQILAYSHRKRGWVFDPYQLRPNFLIHIKTNFGYGSSSYFLIRLKYKGLDIIAFHDWIIYQYAKLYEIVQYTKSFDLQNESWKQVLNYSKEACNLSLTDERSFVNKYIIQECERLVLGLEEALTQEEFKFLNWQQRFIIVHMGGYKLAEYRGQKISGALDFIDKILQFKEIAEVGNFINRIEKCNHKVKPLLENEIPILNSELSALYESLRILTPIYENVKAKKAFYDAEKIKYKELMLEAKEFSDKKFNYIMFEKRFMEVHPDYKKTLEEFHLRTQEFTNLTNQVKSLETIRGNIISFAQKIDAYFSN
ncbi:hypothetical protein FVR03_17170 [Pontibacter qinzhouensis]|uniref:Uncharacterized protein n=1 Tax=Pontibacter qinzhouensis TaxID=2603253 RepID=A0A5C8JE00_9BACT|nr:hypothetical protein [Pontibacter qinzhouensis]TXK36665.1 hypothetical protein FVR03_17170 [Pontibacter qinzhouensis]